MLPRIVSDAPFYVNYREYSCTAQRIAYAGPARYAFLGCRIGIRGSYQDTDGYELLADIDSGTSFLRSLAFALLFCRRAADVSSTTFFHGPCGATLGFLYVGQVSFRYGFPNQKSDSSPQQLSPSSCSALASSPHFHGPGCPAEHNVSLDPQHPTSNSVAALRLIFPLHIRFMVKSGALVGSFCQSRLCSSARRTPQMRAVLASAPVPAPLRSGD